MTPSISLVTAGDSAPTRRDSANGSIRGVDKPHHPCDQLDFVINPAPTFGRPSSFLTRGIDIGNYNYARRRHRWWQPSHPWAPDLHDSNVPRCYPVTKSTVGKGRSYRALRGFERDSIGDNLGRKFKSLGIDFLALTSCQKDASTQHDCTKCSRHPPA